MLAFLYKIYTLLREQILLKCLLHLLLIHHIVTRPFNRWGKVLTIVLPLLNYICDFIMGFFLKKTTKTIKLIIIF